MTPEDAALLKEASEVRIDLALCTYGDRGLRLRMEKIDALLRDLAQSLRAALAREAEMAEAALRNADTAIRNEQRAEQAERERDTLAAQGKQ